MSQWILLAVAIAFLVAVREYASWREAADLRLLRGAPEVSGLWTEAPTGAARARNLELSWEQLPDAAVYRLAVFTVSGSVVMDGFETVDTFWTPPADLLPALPPGEYRWTVEALDGHGEVLARSAETSFRIIGG